MTAHECLDCSGRWTDPHPEEPDDDWSPVDLVPIAQAMRSGDYQPITPSLLMVVGTLALFYESRVNSIFGESGGGKTWVALAAIAEVARGGHRALYIDYEDNPSGITERLVVMGLTDDELELVEYRNPTTGIGRGLEQLEGPYAVAVIDSTGEAMAAGSVDSNADREVAQWFALVKQLARLPGAPAVIVVDHVPKDKDAPASYAIGSQRKRAAVSGAAYRVDTLREPAKGRSGRLKLTVAKDRPGNRAKGTTAAEVEVISEDGAVRIELHPSDAQRASEHGEKFRPTVLMERVSRYLELMPHATGREVEKGVTGKGTGIRTALECLVEEGYAKVTDKGYETVLGYREPVDNAQRVPASQARPSASRDAAEGSASPRPAHTKERDAGRAPDLGEDTTTSTSASPSSNGERVPVDYGDELFDPPIKAGQ